MSADDHIPLFPLHTVLVPGGLLPLRIFESRYLDMVRDCSRDDRGFGVCLLLPGVEGTGYHHARIGTLGRIVDFCTRDDGLLGITVRGERRFRILHTAVRDNGLLMGDVAWLEEPSSLPVPPECALLADLAAGFLDRFGTGYPDHDRSDLDDAAWISYRLTEWLPLDALERQVLLELNDPVKRLQRLLRQLPEPSPDS